MSLWAEMLSKYMLCTLLIVGIQIILSNDENCADISTIPLAKGETYTPHRRGLMRCQFGGFIHILLAVQDYTVNKVNQKS